MSFLGVFADWSERRSRGSKHREVSRGLVGVEGGGGVKEGVTRRKEGRTAEFSRSSQLVNMVLKLLQLLKMS